MKKIPLSVVIITKNEERNMHDCLKSVVDFADEIVIVDDESTDKTVGISKALKSVLGMVATISLLKSALTISSASKLNTHSFLACAYAQLR